MADPVFKCELDALWNIHTYKMKCLFASEQDKALTHWTDSFQNPCLKTKNHPVASATDSFKGNR